MLNRIGDIIGATAGLFDTRARLAARRFERTGLRVAAMLTASLLAAAGLGLLLAGGLIALANHLGWPLALCLGGALAMLTGAVPLVAIAFLQRRGATARASERVLEARDLAWKEKLRAALGQDEEAEPERPSENQRSTPSPFQEILRALVGQVVANPAPVVASVIAASGLLGRRRTWGLLAKAAVVSGSVLPLLRHAADWLASQNQAAQQPRAGSPAGGAGDGSRADLPASTGVGVDRC